MSNVSPTNPSVVITTTPGVSSDNVIDEDEFMPLKQYRKKHMRRLIAIFPANLIMSCGGIQLSSGIYTSFFQKVSEASSHLIYSWFIGAIIGALIAAVRIKMFQKCYFMYAGGALILLNGILCAALPENYAALVASRYLGGIGYGLVFVIAVIYAGEIAPKRLRGSLISTISYATTGGIYAGSKIFPIDEKEKNFSFHTMNQIYGYAFIIVSVISLATTPYFVRESPVFLLQQGKDDEALSMLLTLQKQTVETPGARQQYIEIKNMVNEEETESGNIISDRNWIPLIQGILLRFILALTMSVPINSITTAPFFSYYDSLPAANLGIVFRFLGESGSLCLVDLIGRRKLLLTSVSVSGLLLILIGIIWSYVTDDENELLGIIALYQFFLGIGLTTVSTIYLAEAFPLSKKSLSIFFIFTVECLVHIFIIMTAISEGIIIFIFITAVFLLISGGYFYKFYPETKNLTLKQSIDAVRN